MKTHQVFVIAHVEDGTFLRCTFRHYYHVSDIRRASAFGPNGAQACMERLGSDQVNWRLAPAPQCGCCGEMCDLRLVGQTGEMPERMIWRCEKHVDRAPCLIDGCGRTFALHGRPYSVTFLCGRHWRESPAHMRKAVKRVEALANKRGWTANLIARHSRLYDRTVRAVRDGRTLDMDEVNRMFGWDA